MTDSSSGRNPVDKLAEGFPERQQRGERPSVTEYATRYPQHADTIRELFPVLVRVGAVGWSNFPETRPGRECQPARPSIGSPL
jgi:hypothetical protein